MRKDPDAKLDYALDWGAKWLPAGDTITAATWTVPEGLTQETNPAPSITDGKITTVWLSGGTAGQDYTVTCRVTTAQGRTDDRSLNIEVRNR